MRMLLAVAMLTIGAGGIARGQEAVSRGAAENVREGNKLLDAGQYDEALSKYDAAMKESPETPEIAYNRGIALYRLGKFAEAETAFQDALGTGRLDLEGKAKFNLGRSAHAAAIEKKDNLPEAINDLGRAIGFYNDALQIAPEDADGKKNKEAAERLRAYFEKILAQQQQQQQEKQEPSSQPNEEPTSQPQDQPQTSQPSSQPPEDQKQEGEQEQEGEQDQQQEGEQEQQSDQQEGDQQQDQQQQGKQDQQQKGEQSEDPSDLQESGEQQEKENKMSEEQAERMLQEARDAERERREAQRAKMMRMRGRIPVEKDW